jgi:hypothetical protein
MENELDLEKIDGSETLLDLLISCEAVLDDADLYCSLNWYDGEIISGPIVSRHWVKIGLLYPFDKMPDPRAALRLLRIGIQVEFDRMQRAAPHAILGQEKSKKPDEWLVSLSFPRRLLDQNEKTDLEMYDDDVVTDDIEQAKDSGMDDDSAVHTDEQMPGGEQPQPPAADPTQMQQPPR